MTSRVHIHPPAEEEIVIEAGLPPEAAVVEPADAGDTGDTRGASGVSSTHGEEPGAPSDSSGAAGAHEAGVHEAGAADGGDAQPVKPAKPVKPARPADGYEETTLEDLKGTPMGATQKVIIACAVVGLVAFVIWYLVTYVFV